jgi:hypothetical protein
MAILCWAFLAPQNIQAPYDFSVASEPVEHVALPPMSKGKVEELFIQARDKGIKLPAKVHKTSV